METKGFTVHADDGRGQGYGICGARAREFMGVKGVTADPMRVNCPKCERIQGDACKATQAALLGQKG